MKFARQTLTVLMVMLSGSVSLAAPRCLELSQRQASNAVAFLKIAIAEGSPVLFDSKLESGYVRPLGVWVERKVSGGRLVHRVRIDNRPVDISLIYVARHPGDNRAWNLGWMAGCRPAPGKTLAIPNRH